MKKVFTALSALLIASTTAFAGSFPERDITNVVVWSAGGGTDVSNRVVSAELAKALGVNVNVINKPGGVAGSIGMSHVAQKPADGYTIVGLSESCVTAGVQGGWDKKMDIWYPFIIGGSPDLISVSANSPYNTLTELVEAAKKNPRAIKASAGGAGSIHHLNLLAVMKGTGAEFNFIPYAGSAPAQTAAMTGEVTVVVTSLAEQQQLLKGGKLRALATLTNSGQNLEGVGDIPSAFSAYSSLSEHLPISQAIGMAVRNDAPDAVKEKLSMAFKTALDSAAVKEWAAKNYYVLSGKTGAEARKEFANLESLFGWTLHDLGAAKISPEKLAIAKP
ncbi:tripartite tricarboxylate transporter substrate binding protein [Sedimenticola selenatireducens]|jgi:tripartite-type tricarboxylate transporter receptor subunit TctC|uniref:Tripartite tricarboxylate transporter substrate binding protein n=1 Tax=Sedimenticola selenatireducens TaxID=191960 RepID=A0A557SKF2_9GAMM|nr:tripartite tricarboxylate transporter substrate binding protein [Sedimenticola selenatireducens]TVO77889.1 tripartite tricarboxylate transporter substrate binding protein [Sedimenticola selenatireducens]TVT65194.1 MAG: tripartite tricarboxylate transporter substrate binding protein [Sedimenticola selenatireducens]